MVRLPALQGPKAELYRLFLATGVCKAELARRMGIPKANVDRLFDLRHGSRLDQVEAAFHALGKEIRIEVRPCGAAAPLTGAQTTSPAPAGRNTPGSTRSR